MNGTEVEELQKSGNMSYLEQCLLCQWLVLYIAVVKMRGNWFLGSKVQKKADFSLTSSAFLSITALQLDIFQQKPV